MVNIKMVLSKVDGTFWKKINKCNRYNIVILFRGGGLYDGKCVGIKIGNWIDLDEEF